MQLASLGQWPAGKKIGVSNTISTLVSYEIFGATYVYVFSAARLRESLAQQGGGGGWGGGGWGGERATLSALAGKHVSAGPVALRVLELCGRHQRHATAIGRSALNPNQRAT
jgi:hypothetical protein